MRPAPTFLRRLFSRQTLFRTLFRAGAILAILLAATAVNLIGIRLMGSADAWEHWMKRHAGWFLAWRLLFYGLTAWGWWWMHRRVEAREAGRSSRQRLLRTGIAALSALLLLEASLLLRALEGQ